MVAPNTRFGSNARVTEFVSEVWVPGDEDVELCRAVTGVVVGVVCRTFDDREFFWGIFCGLVAGAQDCMGGAADEIGWIR